MAHIKDFKIERKAWINMIGMQQELGDHMESTSNLSVVQSLLVCRNPPIPELQNM